ncbi:MAG: NAD(P)/FAD-dependent oxidoreductase [Candidatus Thalassarchaeaceae archaeon]|nr:NAD(P)/FAD-dependent oxidoreductase [Candidatus Thalassarchaeaceae archaeon]MDP7257429.1 NAD(P)/FAD-dependent oxidoreductase [Candidatus Thalassarchaeaceae archaeon]MDP7446261.1 NAD(P)/FAD-dependent oxidoreductase [Candidatus Thalassarchaeaceae archaeon]MDP7649151.1 NAD(P)/FAD-dependent oxidoreductase [Candidatus Thalassarchaeaceae archaeon]HJM76720.1 NAD(P)/FAD-dependent oxidoreductase [Candidatus Thalassarchaeaceae archaeon]
MEQWDVVVIGSGAGGMTAAVALANAGKRVLVLEQHYLPGGWTHTFSLEGHRFSPGVHYLGGLEEGGDMRAILEGIGVGGDMEFYELNPDGYDHVIAGDQRFDIPKGFENFKQRLCERFPNERRGIERYFSYMRRIDDEMSSSSRIRPPLASLKALLLTPRLALTGLRPISDRIAKYVSDPFLVTILESRSGDHGVSPARVPAAVHIGIDSHYWEGGWYPKGGGGAFPKALARRLKSQGGQIRLRTMVEGVLIEESSSSRKAVGVRLADGTEIPADLVLSNADPHVTYRELVGDEHLSGGLLRRLDGVEYSGSCLSLFMATDLDLAAMGLDSGNYWICERSDVDAVYRYAEEQLDLGAAGPFPGGFLTVTTLKDPSKMKDGIHTMEAFAFVSHSAFSQWAGSRTDQREEGYERLKEILTGRMLDMLEPVVPGLRDNLLLCDLGTPLTNQYYVNSHMGNLYGTAKTARQVGPSSFPIRTEIVGLFHCGASTTSHGVLGVMHSGLLAAKKMLGVQIRDLLVHSDEGSVTIH